jgi:hypothetical protein
MSLLADRESFEDGNASLRGFEGFDVNQVGRRLPVLGYQHWFAFVL